MPRKPGAKAIVAYAGKMLLVLRDNDPSIPFPNTWNTPGGGIEGDETPEQAIARELGEEVNLVASHVERMEPTIYPDESIVYRFFVPITDEEYTNIYLVSEGQRLDWFLFDEVIDLELSPNHREYFKKSEYEIRNFIESTRKTHLEASAKKDA